MKGKKIIEVSGLNTMFFCIKNTIHDIGSISNLHAYISIHDIVFLEILD